MQSTGINDERFKSAAFVLLAALQKAVDNGDVDPDDPKQVNKFVEYTMTAFGYPPISLDKLKARGVDKDEIEANIAKLAVELAMGIPRE